MRPLALLTLAVAAASPLHARGLSGGGVTGRATDAATGLTGMLAGYVGGRLADFIDIFEVNVGIGIGVKAGVEYGFLRTTLGYVEAARLGLDGRQIGMWSERNVAYGIFPASLLLAPFELLKPFGKVWENLATYGFEAGTLGLERKDRRGFATTSVLYPEAKMVGPWHERPGDRFAFGAEVHALLIGARARVKPLEMLDFVLGIVGVDIDPQLAHPREGDKLPR